MSEEEIEEVPVSRLRRSAHSKVSRPVEDASTPVDAGSSMVGNQKVMPDARDVEAAVLGGMMLDNTRIPAVLDVVASPGYFVSTKAQHVFRAIRNLHQRQQPVDNVSVYQEIRAMGKESTVSGYDVATMAGEVATSANTVHYATLVKEYWRRRASIQVMEAHSSSIYSEHVELEPELDATIDQLVKIREARTLDSGERRSYSGAELRQRRLQGMERRVKMSPMLTFSRALNRKLTLPYFPGGITIVAARPSVGKSALKANEQVYLCESGYGVVSVTPEQGLDRELDRLDSILTGVPLSDIKKVAHWPKGDPRVMQLRRAVKAYSEEWNFEVMARGDVSWADVETVVLERKRRGIKTNVIFVDLMDRLKEVSEAKQGEKANVIKQQLIRGARFAVRENLHVVFLAQILRAFTQQKGDDEERRPNMAWIRDSGGWEEVADTVMLLDSPDKKKRNLDIIIGKQRDGEAGDNVFVRLPFDTKTLKLGGEADWGSIKDPKGISSLHIRLRRNSP